MAEFYQSPRDFQNYTLAGYVYDTIIPAILEDPNPTQGRLFINGQAFDVASLTPIYGKKWSYNLQYTMANLQSLSGPNSQVPDTNFGITSGGFNNLYGMSVYGTAYNEAGGSGASYRFPKFTSHYYHLTLDPQNYPIRGQIKTYSNNILMIMPGTLNPLNGSSAVVQRVFWYNSDVTAPLTNQMEDDNQYNVTSGYYQYFPNALLYEDPAQDVVWGIQTNGYQGSSPYYNSQPITYVRNYSSPASSSITVLVATNGYENFWMGNDVYNNPYFFRINKGANNDPVTVSYINSSSKTLTDILTNQLPSTSFTQLGQNMFPSNVRTAASNRKVFYTAHYDAYGNLAPVQYVWDPTNLGAVTKTNCTMTYPGGTNFFNYANRPILGSQQIVANQYPYGTSWLKPYQFTVGGTTYLTFAWSDHGILNTSTNYLSRFNSPLQRTWLTFSVGSGTNDYQLTYHSKITFSQYSDFPRSWLPTTPSGSTIATIAASGIKFYSFNSATGWVQSGLYNAGGPCIFMGFDQTNRLWGLFGDKGCGSLHIITPSTPVNISLVMANTNYAYTGTSISTSGTLNAYDVNGNRYSTNVTVTIDGTTMTFANGAKSGVITTSNSADTTLNFSISGGGINNITTSINV